MDAGDFRNLSTLSFEMGVPHMTMTCALQAAGNAVKRATEALVRAAKRAKDGTWDDEEGDVAINQRMVGGIAQVNHMFNTQSYEPELMWGLLCSKFCRTVGGQDTGQIKVLKHLASSIR